MNKLYICIHIQCMYRCVYVKIKILQRASITFMGKSTSYFIKQSGSLVKYGISNISKQREVWLAVHKTKA